MVDPSSDALHDGWDSDAVEDLNLLDSEDTADGNDNANAPTDPSDPGNENVDATSNNVLAVLSSDQDGSAFENVMKERTRLRREREDAAIGELRVQVTRLEAALCAETKRRVAAIHNFEKTAKEEFKLVEQRLQKQIKEEGQAVQDRLGVIESRLQALEEKWGVDVEKIQSDIGSQSDSLQKAVQELQEEAERERKARLEREGRLLQQLEDLSTVYAERWQTERQDRLAAITSLTDRMDGQDAHRESQVKSFEERLNVELAKLKQDLQNETQTRIAQDADTVAGLNRYVAEVQRSFGYLQV